MEKNISFIPFIVTIVVGAFAWLIVEYIKSKYDEVKSKYDEVNQLNEMMGAKIRQISPASSGWSPSHLLNEMAHLRIIEAALNDYNQLKHNRDKLKYEETQLRKRIGLMEMRFGGNNSENNIVERVILLAKLSRVSDHENSLFFKCRLDENLEGSEQKFNLYYICQNTKIYKTVVDMKYWDLFDVRVKGFNRDDSNFTITSNIKDIC